MDEELHRYMLRSSRLPDSPPSVHLDTPLSNVSWTNNDLELSRFSGDSEGSAARELMQTEGSHLHFSKENALLRLLFVCHVFLFIRQIQLTD